jgi:hypothetical protein
VRIQAAVVVLILTLVFSVHVTGQQEALPAVRVRAIAADASSLSVTPVSSIVREEPAVYLPLVPLRNDVGEPSLTEAAQNHDYDTFHSQYILAKARGERVAQFDALHELWSWSMSSPTGAFYGPELHARIAAAYPGFARYIEEHQIVDQNGNVFYPTAETRTFLLDQAMRNTTAPRVLIARGESSTTTVTPRVTTGIAPLAPGRSRARTRMQKAETKPLAPKVTNTAKREPVQIAAATLVPAPVVATTAPPVATKTAPQAVAQTAPRAVQKQQPATTLANMTPTAIKPLVPATTNRTGGRAALMIIIGLLGAGVLAVLLRAPKEEPITILPPVQQAPKGDVAGDVAKVEPIRKPESGEPRPQQTSQQTNAKKTPSRANGSRR